VSDARNRGFLGSDPDGTSGERHCGLNPMKAKEPHFISHCRLISETKVNNLATKYEKYTNIRNWAAKHERHTNIRKRISDTFVYS